MKKAAILTVQFDTMSNLYETDIIYLHKITDTKNNDIYISPSEKVCRMHKIWYW